MMSQIMIMIMATTMFNMLWSSSTAVFVSFRDNASAFRSLKALTLKMKKRSFSVFLNKLREN